MKFEQLDDVLTVQEVARALKIGKTKAYDLVNSGELRHIKIGKTIRIPKQYLLNYVYGRREVKNSVS
ncbi:MAG: helix-turn-helix domain-containing protein [Eubacteriales bacterium]|nr:helix-turn-helix domain-containing protein [Eubacteriales bacterium]